MIALSLILPVGAMMSWKRAQAGRLIRPLWPAFVLAVALMGLAFAMQTGRSPLGPIGLALGAWVVFGALTDLWQRTGRDGIAGRIGRLTRLPRSDWGKATAHTGFGVTVFACAAMNAWQIEDIRVMQVGDSFVLNGYTVMLADVHREEGPNYLTTMAEMRITKDSVPVATVFPEKRIYPVAGMPTTEAGIDYGFTRDLYLVIGDPQDGGGWAVRSYFKPFANWIWGGAMLMAIGGFISLADRRFRVAAPARKAINSVPAE
jgi:cytochrome c-type biogenesis protein CcmF